MRSYPNNPDGNGTGAWSDLINRIYKRFTELCFYDSQTITVEQTTRGTRFHLKGSQIQPGQLLYFKVCKEDNTVCYIGVRIEGIFAGPGTGTVEATIPPGSVIPTGATVII